MDPSGSPSFTGVGCLWALLTLWFVPYGIYVLTFLLILSIMTGVLELIDHVFRRLATPG
jgi:predicted metal-binding membrane protein